MNLLLPPYGINRLFEDYGVNHIKFDSVTK